MHNPWPSITLESVRDEVDALKDNDCLDCEAVVTDDHIQQAIAASNVPDEFWEVFDRMRRAIIYSACEIATESAANVEG